MPVNVDISMIIALHASNAEKAHMCSVKSLGNNRHDLDPVVA